MLGVPLLRPGRVLVRAYGRAVDKVDVPLDVIVLIGLHLQLLKDALPQSFFAPLVEAAIDRLPRSIAFRQVPPGGTSTQDPKDSVDDLPVIGPRATGFRFLRWQQRLDLLPLFVR